MTRSIRALGSGVVAATWLMALACGGGGGGGGSNPPPHSLAVAKSGAGAGTIASTPSGIACGEMCAASYASGSSVTLTPTPAAGSAFAGWSGACTGVGPCVVGMDAEQTVTARFIPSTCQTPGGRITIGEFIAENNTYMNESVQDGDFTECESVDTGTTTGLKASWTWSWPHQAQPTVHATPSIIWGFKPWDPGTTTSRLPVPVTEIGSLRVDADVVQTVGADLKSYFGVVAYLTRSASKGTATELPIGKRFFIYRNIYPGVSSSAKPTASGISIDGIVWDLAVGSESVMYYPHADAAKPATALHLDVAHFLEDALRRGAIDPMWWLSSVETAEILYEGTGSLTLDDYQVQLEAAQPVATDRPASSGRRVIYAGGGDDVFGTDDDAVQGYNQIVFDAGGGIQRDAWYRAGGAGGDKTWFTTDDVPMGYWFQPQGAAHGFNVGGPGEDADWIDGDDVVATWEDFGATVGGTATNVLYAGSGTIQEGSTPRDTISAYYVRTVDASGAELRRVTYAKPGPSGWWSGNDVVGGYDVNTYGFKSTRWGAWVRQVNYIKPGPLGWFTADDVIGSCRVHTFLDGTDYWTTETVYSPGADKKCFTSDDQITSIVRATYTY